MLPTSIEDDGSETSSSFEEEPCRIYENSPPGTLVVQLKQHNGVNQEYNSPGTMECSIADSFIHVRNPNFLRQDKLDTVMVSQLQAAIGARLISAVGMSSLFLCQVLYFLIEVSSLSNNGWFIIHLLCIGSWAALFLLSSLSKSFQRCAMSSHRQQLLLLTCYSTISITALIAESPCAGGLISAVVLIANSRIVCKIGYAIAHVGVSIIIWGLAIGLLDDYATYSDVVVPIRFLIACHSTIIASSLMNRIEPLSERSNIYVKTRSVGVGVNTPEINEELSLTPSKKSLTMIAATESTRQRGATIHSESMLETVSHPSENQSGVSKSTISEAEGGAEAGGSDDSGFFVADAGKNSDLQLKYRNDSLCSGSSSISTANSYVSFAASVAKCASGAGYLQLKRHTQAHDEMATLVGDLDDAETFNENQAKSPSGNGNGVECNKTEDPTPTSILDEYVGKYDRKTRSSTVGKRNRPTPIHRRTFSSNSNITMNPVSHVPPSTALRQAADNSNHGTLVDARKEVRELMDINFAVPLAVTHEGVSSFDNLSPAVMHKLVVLVSRLSEETNVLRCNYLIVAGVCEILKCDRASVFLIENKHARTFDDDGIEIKVPLDKSLVGYAALTSRVLNIPDAYSDPRFNKEVDKETGFKTKTLLVYPISRSYLRRSKNAADNKVFAVIEAINKNEGIFTAEDECILALLGKQAGVLLSNSHFYQQLQFESNKTATLLEVSKEISDVQMDLGKMMARIMTRARQVLTVERASIFLIDEGKKELWSILTDSEMAAKVGGDNVIRLPVGVGIAGTVARTGEMLNIADAYRSPLFNPAFDKLSGYVTKAALCVPIRATTKSRVLGVMQFINKTNGLPFIEEDESLATTFSSFVGISLNNILLYDELREGQLMKEKNKELMRLRDEAKKAAEVKANFLMSMSHEIRTPMSGVIGMTELLENTALSPEQQEMVATIRNCGESLLAIINDILDYGRLESGKMELEIACFDLVTLAEDTMDVIRSKVETKNISMNLSVSPCLLTHVAGDSFRLRQVLINLLGNAVKFTPENGEIGMCVSPVEDDNISSDKTLIRFSVTDNGIGIPPDKQAMLFLPFHQASAGTTRQYGGSGLGLSICKQLVACMGGEFGVVSDPETKTGSTFWITAYFRKVTEDGKNMNVGNRLRSEFKVKPNLRALVASSNETQVNIFTAYLSLFGAHCEHVSTATQLTNRVQQQQQQQQQQLDIIIIDSHSLDGCSSDTLEVVTQSISESITIGVVTPMVHKARTVQLLRKGAVFVLAKPPKQALLAGILQTASSENPVELRRIQSLNMRPKKETIIESSRKLMVAEDNKTNQILIKKQLKLFGIEPTVCDNGQMVIDELLVNRHDIILMDCHMPVLDGYGATKLIREMEKSGKLQGQPVNIIALTADALPHTRDECLQAGMDDYITKPLRKNILKATLEKWYVENNTDGVT